MRNIGIMTFTGACNYGAVLQCYALRQVLKRFNQGSVEAPLYYPEYFIERYSQHLTRGWQLNTLLRGHLKTWLKHAYVKCVKCRRNAAFHRFLHEKVEVPMPCYSVGEVEQATQHIDTWVTGSDQVWSPTCAFFDPVFFLDFKMKKGSRKFSYAASFGNITEVPEECHAEMRRRLEGYDAYSVREQAGADIVRNIIGKEAMVHCDPSLLLTAEEWESVASRTKRQGYILVYHVTKHEPLLQEAVRLSEKTGLPVIVFTSYFGWRDLGGDMRRKYGYTPAMHSGPEDFIALFRDADYVITNSFHGTAFSLLFHKEFCSHTIDATGKRNERALNLLSAVGVDPDRRIGDASIDWQTVDARLASLRHAAFEYLQHKVCADI